MSEILVIIVVFTYGLGPSEVAIIVIIVNQRKSKIEHIPVSLIGAMFLSCFFAT